MADPAPVEVRFAVDAGEAPLVYPDTYPDTDYLAVEIAGPGVVATLVVPTEAARAWAGELFDAVAVAYREATGDPHALSDDDLTALPPADAYDPGPGPLVVADDDGPARVRFWAVVDIQGACLATPELRAAIVEALSRFNTTRIAVSAGQPLAGRLA